MVKLKCSISKLEEKIEDAEAYERRDTLVFSGAGIPTAVVGENSSQMLCDLIEEKLKIKISKSDICTAHRIVQKPTNQQPNKRKIIAKLCHRDLKSFSTHADSWSRTYISTKVLLLHVAQSCLFFAKPRKCFRIRFLDVTQGMADYNGG